MTKLFQQMLVYMQSLDAKDQDVIAAAILREARLPVIET